MVPLTIAHLGVPPLAVLRYEISFVGPRFGCWLARCICRAVLIDGAAEKRCPRSIWNVVGKSVTTVEGLATLDGLQALPAAVSRRARPMPLSPPCQFSIRQKALFDRIHHPRAAPKHGAAKRGASERYFSRFRQLFISTQVTMEVFK
jgi:hypothetical protein